MATPRLALWTLLVVALLARTARADWPPFDGQKGSPKPAPEAAAPEVGPEASVDSRLLVVVRAPTPAERGRAASLGLDIQGISGETATGVVTPAGLARLLSAGFAVVSQTPLRQASKAFPPQDKAYHDYARVQSVLSAIASAHPDFASVVEIGKSIQERKLLALRFNRAVHGPGATDKPGALFVGNHHAREHLSTEVPLLAAQWIADNAKKPDVKALLDTRDIWFVPMLNPDGSEHDIATGQYQYWRKNMRKNSDGSFGVDPNRNYGSHWGEAGTSTYPDDDTYGGPGAFSEPETLAIKAFLDKRPNVKTMITYHSFAELILYPWSYTEEPLTGPALKAFKAMGEKMAGWTGYVSKQSSELYPSSGDTCDWAWEAHGVFCFTIELTPKYGGGGFYPGSAVIGPTVSKNVPPILYLIGLADDPLRAASQDVASR